MSASGHTKASHCPSCTLCMDSDLVMGSNIPFMVTASVMPLSARLSTWSFIKDCKGEMTTVIPAKEKMQNPDTCILFHGHSKTESNPRHL